MKEWTCICGSKVFILTSLGSTVVDFGLEGAIEGHPYITRGGNTGKSSLVCAGCHTRVQDDVADKMIKEIV